MASVPSLVSVYLALYLIRSVMCVRDAKQSPCNAFVYCNITSSCQKCDPSESEKYYCKPTGYYQNLKCSENGDGQNKSNYIEKVETCKEYDGKLIIPEKRNCKYIIEDKLSPKMWTSSSKNASENLKAEVHRAGMDFSTFELLMIALGSAAFFVMWYRKRRIL